MEKVYGVLVMNLLEMLLFSSSSYTYNIIEKNKSLVLDEGPTGSINNSTGTAEKKLLILVKQYKILLKFAFQWWWELPVCK